MIRWHSSISKITHICTSRKQGWLQWQRHVRLVVKLRLPTQLHQVHHFWEPLFGSTSTVSKSSRCPWPTAYDVNVVVNMCSPARSYDLQINLYLKFVNVWMCVRLYRKESESRSLEQVRAWNRWLTLSQGVTVGLLKQKHVPYSDSCMQHQGVQWSQNPQPRNKWNLQKNESESNLRSKSHERVCRAHPSFLPQNECVSLLCGPFDAKAGHDNRMYACKESVCSATFFWQIYQDEAMQYLSSRCGAHLGHKRDGVVISGAQVWPNLPRFPLNFCCFCCCYLTTLTTLRFHLNPRQRRRRRRVIAVLRENKSQHHKHCAR